MKEGLWDFFQITGALAFFIYGMKVMSEGIQKAAGSQMRNILRTMTKNRYLGVLTGFITTALVQSSSATTVMTVSFVNAGLISLVESAGIMMGANVGTTITGWLISILGFKVKLAAYSLPLFAIGLPMLMFGKSKIKAWGEFIIGFAILFMGLNLLKGAVPDIKSNPEILNFLAGFADWGILSRIFFILVGTLLTVVVQSSSAAMALTLTLCSQGILPFDIAAAMILGENIGTTITAYVASMVGNVHAKRSARFHSIFNVIGVVWMVLAMPLVLKGLSWFLTTYFGMADPLGSDLEIAKESIPIALSAFHTTFNILNVVLLIGFLPYLVKLSIYLVKESGDSDDTYRLQYIGTSITTTELSILEAQKEVSRFGEVTSRMPGFARKLLDAKESPKRQRKMLKKLAKYEEITDRFEVELTEYLTLVSKKPLSPKMSIRVRSILNIGNDMERIGDVFFQISKTLERKIDDQIWFNQHQRDRLNEMFDLIDEAFNIMMNNLDADHYDKVSKGKAMEMEGKINELRNVMRRENTEAMEKEEDYNIKSAMIYNNLFSSLEKVGDHIINVTESVVGEI
jgi:phosphate:Na+ symporter